MAGAGGEAGRAGAGGAGHVRAGAAGHTGQALCKQDMGHGLGSKGEEAPQQQLSERPGVWSVPHQWGVQLRLRMKASERERERIKGSQGLL